MALTFEKDLSGGESGCELFCGGSGTLGGTCRWVQAGLGRMARTHLQTFQLPKVEPTSKSPKPHVPSSPQTLVPPDPSHWGLGLQESRPDVSALDLHACSLELQGRAERSVMTGHSIPSHVVATNHVWPLSP